MRTEIIYEDRDLLVIWKSAGLATQTAKTGQADVVSELKNHLVRNASGKGQPYLGIIHRLDQPVEGLLVFGKNRSAAAALTRQMGDREGSGTLNKQYRAVICGKPASKEGELVDYLYKNPEGRAVIVEHGEERAAEGADCKGKRAALRYSILQTVDAPFGGLLSLADIRLDTGRFHQIRAQMSHAGMALLGDIKYGNELTRAVSDRLGIRTTALCACRLAFVHPTTGERLCFERYSEARAFSFFKG